jgi:inhibitor of cysteine peptidase
MMHRLLRSTSFVVLGLFALGGGCIEGSENSPRTPTAPSGRIVTDAPIDELEVLILESFPVQYNLRIVSGLPSGCAEFEKAEVTGRRGNELTVRVTNTLPDDPNIACTAIYGTKETTLPLGSDFNAGETYSIVVNDTPIEFTAQ